MIDRSNINDPDDDNDNDNEDLQFDTYMYLMIGYDCIQHYYNDRRARLYRGDLKFDYTIR